MSLTPELPCCLIFYWPSYHNLSTHKDDICLKTQVLRDTPQSSRQASLCRGTDYRLILGRVGHSSRLHSATRKTLWKTRLSPDSTPAVQRQHCSAAARLCRWVTRAQPSARVQEVNLLPDRMTAVWSKNGSKRCIMKPEEGWRIRVCLRSTLSLAKCIGHSRLTVYNQGCLDR